MEIKTHKSIDEMLSGKVVDLKEGESATVVLQANDKMIADKKGLIHGGFIFSAADYCAMVTVNHPNVVLASAEVKFLQPFKIYDVGIFKSKVLDTKGRWTTVLVEGFKGEEKFFEGTFRCYTSEKHVLEK